ncbi:uncharacterized protein LOC125489248 [Plutella xylostella]|uniref:uncharacterized protein LOC125489248 n=1 Tax=Plutella xylostella TaxID=51655 RepID=UPI002032AAA5|nr:uncharacterized protein LOC125489248 [Plutella xylostella]
MDAAAAAQATTDQPGDETENVLVPSDPAKWDGGDVRRWTRWAARTFRVRVPRAHLLPDRGAALLALTEDQWLQVCESPQAAQLLRAHLQHARAAAAGLPPPPPLDHHVEAPETPSPTGGHSEFIVVKSNS